MLKKILFFTVFSFFLTSAKATHIVGGEIEVKHISANNYQISLNLYFDAINGVEGAIDSYIFPSIFRKSNNQRVDNLSSIRRTSDNTLISYLFLPKVSDTPIAYNDPKCAVGSLRTRHIVYKEVFTLDPAFFSDPQGYYISWERCCRNYIIENIAQPESAAQVFYTEFPAIAQNGVSFINSSPSFAQPQNPYACLNQPFTLDWGTADPDGDQLIYSLRTPANGNGIPYSPAPWGLPAPYSSVNWLSGYGINNMIQGNPALKISQNGLLSMTPSQTGLFVFAVACEEYRNGVKIGETVREFQIMVLDCGGNTAPEAKLKLIDNEEFYDASDVMIIEVNAINKCTKLQVTDVDNNTAIKAKVTGLNFDASSILREQTGNIKNGAVDKLLLEVCFDQLPVSCVPYEMEFEVEDNTCGSPLRNKLKVKVLVRDNIAPIVPILECISLNEDGTKTATFGYNNFNTEFTSVAVGANNNIVGATFSGQPTAFQFGRWYNVFQINYTGNQVPTWEIATGTCNRNVSSTVATVCATPCNTETERFLIRNVENSVGILLESPEKIEMDFQEGAYIEVNAEGNAYLFAELKVRSSDNLIVPAGTLWRLRLFLNKSATELIANKEELENLITQEINTAWNYFEVNTSKSSLTQLNGTGTINLVWNTSSQLFFSINYRDENAKGSLNIALERTCSPIIICQDYALKVVEYNGTKRKDGLPIDETTTQRRNDPQRALGAPQENDGYNFVSLGFGGSIVLELGSPVYNHNKNGVRATHTNTALGKEISFADLVVVETSFGRALETCGINQDENYPERARFYGTESLDKEWVLLGEDCRTTFVDVAPAIAAGHRFVKYLKIEDVSDVSYFVNSAEGYDVDGIILCPEAVIAAISGGNGRNPLLDARTENIARLDGAFLNQAPNEIGEYSVQLYPNPTNDKAFLNVILPESKDVTVQIFDITGKMVKNIVEKLDAGSNQLEIKLSDNTKGLYLLKIYTTEGSFIRTLKMVKE